MQSRKAEGRQVAMGAEVSRVAAEVGLDVELQHLVPALPGAIA